MEPIEKLLATQFLVAENLPEGVSEEDVIIPKRATERSAGYDLYSAVEETVPAHSWKLIHTGVTCALWEHQFLAVVPRSGLALKKGITVLNAPGTVDADYYPNPIGVILFNNSDEDFKVNKGDRIAQGIIMSYWKAEIEDDSNWIAREGGFGSTGV